MSFLANILAEKSKKGLFAPCIYTTGCTGQEAASLPELLDYLDARLIDIRFAPRECKTIQWHPNYLRLLLRDRYRHIPHLGNRLTKEASAPAIQNLALGIRIITEMRANLLLMCECSTPAECHRLIISQSLKKQGFDTQEIADWSSMK